MSKKILLMLLLNTLLINCNVDFVIYSYDRPMQLYALLESMKKNIIGGLGEVHIIYRSSNNRYSTAYDNVIKSFNDFKFHKQGKRPQADFKPLVIKSAFESPNEYVSFVVDDIILKDKCNLNTCIKYLNCTNAYCFLLRLGKNINRCYTMKIDTPMPSSFKNIGEDIFIWTFKDGLGDWNFPSNNDMTIYKKSDIRKSLEEIEQIYFTNTFYEPYWCTKTDRNLQGLCFEFSKIVNLCINVVILEQPSYHQFSTEWNDKFFSLYSPDSLLNKFLNGFKFNIDEIYKINNPSPHIEYNLEFVKQEILYDLKN